MFFSIKGEPGKRTSHLLNVSVFLLCIIGYTNMNLNKTAELKQQTVEVAERNGIALDPDTLVVENIVIPGLPQMWKGFTNALFLPIIEEEYDDLTGALIPNDSPKTLSECDTLSERWHMLKTGRWQLFSDMYASGKRLVFGMFFILLCVLIGLYMGMMKYVNATLYNFIVFFDKVPALLLLPLLFIIVGLGENTKIALIVIGVAPTVILDVYLHVKKIPSEQISKGFTLNASESEIIYKIVFPQILPNVMDTIRLQFKAVIIFLVAGEALAASSGMGYRIFLVKRHMDMATIIPYIIILSLFAFAVDSYLLHRKNNIKWLANN